MKTLNLKNIGRSELACQQAILLLSGLNRQECCKITNNLPHSICISQPYNEEIALSLLMYWGANYTIIEN